MKALLKNYRQSPRKVRIVADLIRGMGVSKADLELTHLTKRSAKVMRKLLNSAVANAGKSVADSGDSLFIKKISVDEGVTAKRWMPRAFGKATPIRKRSSHIKIELGEKQ